MTDGKFDKTRIARLGNLGLVRYNRCPKVYYFQCVCLCFLVRVQFGYFERSEIAATLLGCTGPNVSSNFLCTIFF